MWNKLSSRFTTNSQSFLQRHDIHTQYASIAVSLLASAVAVMRTSRSLTMPSKRDKNNFFFIAMIALFIAHSVAFGYQRLVLEPGNRMAGVGAAIAAMTAFTRAAMCMQERGQLAGMIVVAGGVVGCLCGMMQRRQDKVILEASRWMMAVCAPMVVLAKAPMLMSGQVDTWIALLQTSTTGLRLAAFKRFHERGLYAYMLANFTICLSELLLSLLAVFNRFRSTEGKVRRSTRTIRKKTN